MMAIDEELVALDAVEVDDPTVPTDIPNPAALIDPILIGKGSFYRVSESGTWGDPSDATVERGEEYFEVITEAVASLINTFQDIRDDIYKRDMPSEEERFS